jgi:hypothetical protein
LRRVAYRLDDEAGSIASCILTITNVTRYFVSVSSLFPFNRPCNLFPSKKSDLKTLFTLPSHNVPAQLCLFILIRFKAGKLRINPQKSKIIAGQGNRIFKNVCKSQSY